MNERIKELAEQAGGEFWQRIESDGVLNKEAYITFDPPQSLEKFAELIVRECVDYCKGHILPKDVAEQNGLTYNDGVGDCAIGLEQHFGVEEK